MRNPLTIEVESYAGAGFLVLFTGFLLCFFFIATKNLHSELDILDTTQAELKTNSTQRELIEQWMAENHIELSEGQTYRSLFEQYPDKPWLH